MKFRFRLDEIKKIQMIKTYIEKTVQLRIYLFLKDDNNGILAFP